MRNVYVESLEIRRLLADGYAAGVTGGAGGPVVTATTAVQLNSYINQAGAVTIQVQGTIDLRPLDGGNGRVFTKGNKTIRGVGTNPTVIGNLNVTDGVSNVIVENLFWTNPGAGADGLTIWNGHNVFVNHVSFYDCGDGMCDVNNGSNDVTVSWCKFYYPSQADHRFTMIADGTAAAKLRITLHHNWWAERADQRMPASTNGLVHMYNNYFSCSGNSYASNARLGTQILSEHNYYDVGVRDPIGVSVGTDGQIRTVGNIYNGTLGTIHPGTDGVFTPTYPYALDAAADVPAIVTAGAGWQPANVAPAVASPASATSVPFAGSDFFVNPTGANGAFTSIQAAINAVPAGTAAKRTRIFVAPGTYTETAGANANLNITKPFVSLIGTGASALDVVIRNAVPGLTGATRVQSSASDFVASNLTFQNTLGDNAGQAVALRGSADRAAFLNCRFLGFQDTLLVDNNSRQYFRDCYITGDTDFIFGSATAVFDRCTINSTDAGYITAAETSPNIANGLIFLDCTLTASGAQVGKPGTTYLGRPWHWDQGKVPSTTFIRTRIGAHVHAAGWHPWDTVNNTNPDATTRYAEFASARDNGAPLNTAGRVAWADPMTATHAANYTLVNIFGASASFWTASTQPETTGAAYTSQGAGWNPAAALATLQFGRGPIVALAALGADAAAAAGEAGLSYAWSVTSKPAGATDPIFTANGTNAAKNTAASFSTPGDYTFLVTMTDAGGLATTTSVSVTVQPAPLTIAGTGNADSWYARLAADGRTLEINPGDDGVILPIYRVSSALLQSISFDLLGGDDALRLIDLNDAMVASTPIRLLGGGGEQTLSIDGGSFRFDMNIAAQSPLTGLKVVNGAAVTLNATQQLVGLTIGAGSHVTVAAEGSRVLRAATLDIAAGGDGGGGGTLDLNDNTLLTETAVGTVIGGVYGGVQGAVQRAYNFGGWDGVDGGLMTSMPDAAPNVGVTTIAVAPASRILFIGETETGVFAGQTVTGATTIARYTYAGDVNFDGLVDAADYGFIDNSIQFPGTDGYANGDFNYDGVIDAADYGIIDNSIQLQGPPLAPAHFANSGFQPSAPPSTFSTVYFAASSSESSFAQLTRRERSEPGPEFLYSR